MIRMIRMRQSMVQQVAEEDQALAGDVSVSGRPPILFVHTFFAAQGLAVAAIRTSLSLSSLWYLPPAGTPPPTPQTWTPDPPDPRTGPGILPPPYMHTS